MSHLHQANRPHFLSRYRAAFSLAGEKHWPHNLVLVTHGLGVQRALSLGLPRMEAYNVNYCGYVTLERDSKIGPWKFVASEGVNYAEVSFY